MSAVRWLMRLAVGGAALAAAAAVSAEGNGLVVRSWAAGEDSSVTLSPLRTRMSIGIQAPAAGLASADAAGAAPSPIVGGRLLGDYYFSRPRLADGQASGFRATSGLLFGPRLGAWAAAPALSAGLASVSVERRDFGLLPGSTEAARRLDGSVTVPYLGLGYSDAFARGRWGLSADVGLVALRQSDAVRLGRPAGSPVSSVDDSLRQLRLAPLLQLGVSYSF